MPNPSPSPPPHLLPTPPSSAVSGRNLGVSPTPRHVGPVPLSEINKSRIGTVVSRLAMHFQPAFRSDALEFSQLCLTLARGIDYAISHNDIAPNAELPFLLKQVYQRKSDDSLQAAIMVLMLSVKNACKHNWFKAEDSKELLKMESEISRSFCVTENITSGSSNVLRVISEITLPRYYPRIKLKRMIASFEIKMGYEILAADIFIPRIIAPEERIRLFVVQLDNTGSSACIISPPQVSFLVNGKGVDRRTNVSMDTGPQFPTDITKMLKYGMNLFQAVGSFSGNFVIGVAVTTENIAVPVLQDYVQPAVEAVTPDTEIIEGSSRISLNCPISFKHIKTPVKGHLCKHHQCFDFDNYMDMNSRKPCWRCPHCNQSVSCIDLRIDQKMVKILEETAEGVSDVILSADGTWKVAEGPQSNTVQSDTNALTDQHVSNARSKITGVGNDVAITDLTDDDSVEAIIKDSGDVGARGLDPILGGINPRVSGDRKPFQDIFQHLPDLCYTSLSPEITPQGSNPTCSSTLPSTLASNSQTVHNMGAHSQTMAAPESYANTTGSVASAVPLNLQVQQPESSVVRNEVQRPPIPRHAFRTPVAVQALPAAQNLNHTRRPQTNTPWDGSSGVSYQLSHSQSFLQGGFSTAGTSDMQHHSDVQQSSDRGLGLRPSEYPGGTRNASDLSAVGHSGPFVLPHSDILNSFQQNVNSHVHQTLSQLASTFPQSPTVQGQHWSSQTAASAAAGIFQQTLLAESRAALLARLGPGFSSLQATTPTTSLATTDISSISERLHMGGGIRQAVRLDGLSESPTEANWRPTGRMRGSLSGEEYSAAISMYTPTLTPPMTSMVPNPFSQPSAGLNTSNVQAPTFPR